MPNAPSPPNEEEISGKDAAALLKITPSRLCRLAKMGVVRKLTGRGNKWRPTLYVKADILAWDERRRNHPCSPGRGKKAAPVF